MNEYERLAEWFRNALSRDEQLDLAVNYQRGDVLPDKYVTAELTYALGVGPAATRRDERDFVFRVPDALADFLDGLSQ